MEEYNPPNPGYDPSTWKQKLEFQRNSFRVEEKEPYRKQPVCMDTKIFMVPFMAKCCAIPWKIPRERIQILYARYRYQMRELKYIEDCFVERMNAGKMNLPASPLPSFPGQDQRLLNKPEQYTDKGGRFTIPQEESPQWEARLVTSRDSQQKALLQLLEDPNLHPKPPKQSEVEKKFTKILEQIAAEQR
jgi:hypothetical protein